MKAAIEVVNDLGVIQTNSYTVTKKLKVSQPSFFYHFPTQADFYRELVNYIVTLNAEGILQLRAAGQTLSNVDRLKAYIAGTMLWAEQHPARIDVLLFGTLEGTRDPKLRDIVKAALQGGEENVYSFLVAGVAEKEFELRLPPRTAAFTLHKAITGASLVLRGSLGTSGARDKMTADTIALAESLLIRK